MEEIKIMTKETGTEISEAMDNGFKYSKDDILQMCNVSERTFRSFLAMQLISQRDFTSIGSSHKQFYSEKWQEKCHFFRVAYELPQKYNIDLTNF